MTVTEFADLLATLAKEHPNAEVAFVTFDREYGIHGAEFNVGELGPCVLVYSDEQDT